MITTVMDSIEKAIKEKFAEMKINMDSYSRDIVSFNSTGTKAIAIFDNCNNIERDFVLIGVQPNLEGDWKATYYKDTDGSISFDGIDAMCDADSFLNY